MQSILARLVKNERLSRTEAEQLMLDITREQYSPIEIAGMLTALAMRGVSVDELVGFRSALLSTRVPIDLAAYRPIDIVGTGGDQKNTFNISTCACFVVAGAGYHVAKHGNKAATSVSGASNVLQEHGVQFSNAQDVLTRSIEESGVAYMHAPLFNPAMKSVAPVRSALHIPTVFNLLGPLINPSLPPYQLLGVANLEQMRLYTETLTAVGVDFTVVTSLDGYDEASLTTDFKVMTNRTEHVYSPADLGLPATPAEELNGGDTPAQAMNIFDAVLAGRSTEGQKNTVLTNAALAIRTLEPEKSLAECLDIARASLDSGRAAEKFRRFVEINQ